MAKALKVAALVVGVAALAIVTGGAAAGIGISLSTSFLGVSASTLLLASAGLQVGAGVLAKKGSTTSSQTDRLTTSLDPRAPRKTWLGATAGGNDLRYEEWFGAEQEYCGWIVALASHKIDGLDAIYINQDLAWSLASGVQPKYQGYFYLQHLVLEGSPTNTVVVSDPDTHKWGPSARLTGCAYAHIQFRVTGVNSKATSPFSGGVPSRLTFVGRGGMVYDPRRDGSLPGGAGPMRPDDQSTWRFTADDGATIGGNIPLQILRVLLGWRITNPVTGAQKLAVGCGLPARRIDLGSFMVAAGIADELANRSTGGSEPKFHGGALLSEGDDAHSQLDMLCAACNGRLRDVNGKLALVIMHDDLAGAATDDGLGDDDVIGGFTWESDPPLDQCVNVVRGKYTDPSTASLYQMIDYPDVSLPSPDGIDRVLTLDLSVAQSPSHAQRVAKQVLERRQYQRTFSAPFDIRAWKYQVGDVVPVTFSPLSFDRRLFRVSAQELGQDGECLMSLVDENPAIYAWDADDTPAVVAAAPIVYDPTKSPYVLAIGEAATTAKWSGVADDDGQRPEDGATVGAPFGTHVGDKPVEVVLDAIELIGPVAVDVSALKDAKVGTDAAIGALTAAGIDLAAAGRQADADRAAMSEALLRLVSEAGRTRDVLRDAGVVVDPATGAVRIYAVDQLAERTSRAEIALDAATATITSKASVSYVDQAILLAQLDPATAANLSPLIARITNAESDIDGLNAAVALKASALELAALSGRLTTVSQTVDALAGTVTTKADRTVVDQLAETITSVTQTLGSYGDVAGLSVDVRQARSVADDAAEAGLRALLGGDAAAQRQITSAAEAREELYTRLTDGLASEATARTLLAVKLGAADAQAVQQLTALAAADKVQAQRIDALGVTADGQAAAIGTLQQASITAAGAIAGLTTTIRQQAGADDGDAEATLRALIAGDDASRGRAAQLVQIQSELTTTLVANEQSAAVARQALLARLGAAEAAIVTTSKVLTDRTQALATRMDASDAAYADPATGLPATRAALSTETSARAAGDKAQSDRTDAIQAALVDPKTGLAATQAQIVAQGQTMAAADKANADAIAQVSASVGGEAGARAAAITTEQQARIDGDATVARSVTQVSSTVGTHQAAIELLFETVGGNSAVAQLAVDTDGNMVGFRIDGADHTFKVRADRFIVGSEQVFEVDTTTGKTTMHDVEVDTLAVNTAITPAFVSATDSIQGTGAAS